MSNPYDNQILSSPTATALVGKFDNNDSEQDIIQIVSKGGTVVAHMNADLTIDPSPYPLNLGQLNAVNVMTAQSLVVTSPLDSLYQVTIYIASHNTGVSTSNVQLYITYTDLTGIGPQTFGVGILGTIAGSGAGPLNSQNFMIPFISKADTPITISTAFTGTAEPFAYDLAVRVVLMPQRVADVD